MSCVGQGDMFPLNKRYKGKKEKKEKPWILLYVIWGALGMSSIDGYEYNVPYHDANRQNSKS